MTRLPRAGFRDRAYDTFLVAALFTAVACQRPTQSTSETNVSTEPAVVTSTTSSANDVTFEASSTRAFSSTTRGVDSWALGVWRGVGTARVAKLELPGNQGVQLAWVKDKGTKFVGPVDVTLEVTSDGAIRGAVTGSFGALSAVGNWDGQGALNAQLNALYLNAMQPTPDAFSGLLTIPFSAPTTAATASVRVVSNDGQWVRQADVQLALVK